MLLSSCVCHWRCQPTRLLRCSSRTCTFIALLLLASNCWAAAPTSRTVTDGFLGGLACGLVLTLVIAVFWRARARAT